MNKRIFTNYVKCGMFVTPVAVVIQFCIYYSYKSELQRQKRMCKKLQRQLEESSNREN